MLINEFYYIHELSELYSLTLGNMLENRWNM